MLPLKKSGTGTRAIIVASGPSVAGFTPPRGVPIIAVNTAIDWVDRASYFFTLDPSRENLRRMKHRRRGTQYCCALPPAHADIPGVYRFERIGDHSTRGPEPEEKGTPAWWLWRWSCMPGLATEAGKIHSGNSAYGALGLALHLGYTDVALVGVDGTQAPRHHDGGTPNDLSHLGLLFASALPQINVVSCGLLDSIPQTTLKEWLDKTR